MSLSNVSTDDILKELSNRGYAVRALWCIDDVQSRFKADDATALSILNDVLDSEFVCEDIVLQISHEARERGIGEIEEEHHPDCPSLDGFGCRCDEL